MALEDLDWRRGELVVRGEARREEALPLQADVGEAIAGCLQSGKPEADLQERVPALLRAAARAVESQAVSGIVYDACDRAGIARIGAHHLRHTAASQMLAQGASLAEGRHQRHSGSARQPRRQSMQTLGYCIRRARNRRSAGHGGVWIAFRASR